MKTPSEHNPEDFSCLGSACCVNCIHGIKEDPISMRCPFNPGFIMPNDHTCDRCERTPAAEKNWKNFHYHHYYEPKEKRLRLTAGWYKVKNRNLYFMADVFQVSMPTAIKPYKPHFQGLVPLWCKCEGLYRIKRIVKTASYIAPVHLNKIPYSIAVSMFGKLTADKIDATWIQKDPPKQMELFSS